MIPSPDSQSYHKKIGISGSAMSVIMDEKSAHTLSSVIYSSHRRIEAVVRELCTNAYDSHIKAGNESIPIEVTLPVLGFPYLMIQDRGVGLAKKDGEKFFGTYFASGSQFEKKPTGYYGLGAKSPHAYTDAYEIMMVKDGLKSTMLCFKNEEGVPAYNVLAADEPTSDPNGVCFKVPVKENDFKAFHKAASFVLPMFAVQPTVINAEDSLVASFRRMKDCKDASCDFDRISVMIFNDDSLPSAILNHPSRNSIMVRMGNILYPANANLLEKEEVVSRNGYFYELYNTLKNNSMYMLLEIDITTHGMTVEPGREKIITNAKNMATLEALCERVVKKLKEQAKADYGAQSAWQVSRSIIDKGGFDKLREESCFQYLKAHLYGARPYLSISDITRLMNYYGVNISVIRANGDLSKTSSMSASRFLSNNHGYFNPKKIRNIIIHNDRKVKVADASRKLRDFYIQKTPEGVLQQEFLRNKGQGQFTVLGILIRAIDKNSDAEGFAKALFGKNEYSFASDLMSCEIDLSKHERLIDTTARHYSFNSYSQNLELQPKKISLFKLKTEGRFALKGKCSRNDIIYMSDDEFLEKKEEIVKLYRMSGRGCLISIVVSDEHIENIPGATTIEKFMKKSFKYFDLNYYIRQRIKGLLIHNALVEENAVSSTCVSSSYNLISQVVSRKSELQSLFPNTGSQDVELIKTYRSSLVETPDFNIKETIEQLSKYKLIDESTGWDLYENATKNKVRIKELIHNILEIFRKKPLEASFYFSVSPELVLNLRDSVLSEASGMINIEHQLKSFLEKNTSQNKEAA